MAGLLRAPRPTLPPAACPQPHTRLHARRSCGKGWRLSAGDGQRQHGAGAPAPKERQSGPAEEPDADDPPTGGAAPPAAAAAADAADDRARLSVAHLALLASAGFAEHGGAAAAADAFPQLLGGAAVLPRLALPVRVLQASGVAVHAPLRLVAAPALPDPLASAPGRGAAEPAQAPLLRLPVAQPAGAEQWSIGVLRLPAAQQLHRLGVREDVLAGVVRDAPAALAPGGELPAVIAWLQARGVGALKLLGSLGAARCSLLPVLAFVWLARAACGPLRALTSMVLPGTPSEKARNNGLPEVHVCCVVLLAHKGCALCLAVLSPLAPAVMCRRRGHECARCGAGARVCRGGRCHRRRLRRQRTQSRTQAADGPSACSQWRGLFAL